ncbi:hypothetical protein CTA1_8286 [Colletotrichum tanaceti]|uniref:Uncharacterized protein n=1 Tax=Colletotrichum tanaceti TaxID=1306861 RepID=A0A4U6X719_9PEZI|nr:hypothetical protein CTA1_8286 [Colletotrichum tanaceti]
MNRRSLKKKKKKKKKKKRQSCPHQVLFTFPFDAAAVEGRHFSTSVGSLFDAAQNQSMTNAITLARTTME